MALNEIQRSNDPSPDGGGHSFLESQPTRASENMLSEVFRDMENVVDKDFLGEGVATLDKLIPGSSGKNIHNEAAVERDPKGELKALNFAQGQDLMDSINERNKLGHVGLYSLMQGQGDNIHQMAGHVAEKKLMANV